MSTQQALIAACSATQFEAETPEGLIVLRIGERSEALARLYRVTGTQTAAYVTAWNPGSVPQAMEQNRSAQSELLGSRVAEGYRHYEGFGREPTGQWPSEGSVLVLGISAGTACTLGCQHGQAAIVVVAADAVPQLRWLSEWSSLMHKAQPSSISELSHALPRV